MPCPPPCPPYRPAIHLQHTLPPQSRRAGTRHSRESGNPGWRGRAGHPALNPGPQSRRTATCHARAHPPWRPRNPPPTRPSRQRPPATCHPPLPPRPSIPYPHPMSKHRGPTQPLVRRWRSQAHKAVAPATAGDLPSATTASTLNPLSSTHEHAQRPHPAPRLPLAQPSPQSRRAATPKKAIKTNPLGLNLPETFVSSYFAKWQSYRPINQTGPAPCTPSPHTAVALAVVPKDIVDSREAGVAPPMPPWGRC